MFVDDSVMHRGDNNLKSYLLWATFPIVSFQSRFKWLYQWIVAIGPLSAVLLPVDWVAKTLNSLMDKRRLRLARSMGIVYKEMGVTLKR